MGRSLTRSFAALIALCAVCAAATAAPGDPRDPRLGARISMRFSKVDLPRLVRTMAQRLDERFLFDSSLSGRVTIAVPRPVSRDEAWELLHAALALRGYAATPVPGGGYKIVPLPQVQDEWRLVAPAPEGESRILTLVPLRVADPDEMLALLRPLLDGTTLAIAFAPGSSLIIGTRQRNLRALIALIREFDRPRENDVHFRRLRNANAPQVAATVEAHFAGRPGLPARIAVWADARTNALAWRAPATLREAVERLVDALDAPAEGVGQLRVLPIRHADVTRLAEKIGELTTDTGRSSVDAASGRRISEIERGLVSAVADPHSHSLIVEGSPEALAATGYVVSQLDQPPRQVAVDIWVEKLAYDDSFQLGLQGLALAFESKDQARAARDALSNPIVATPAHVASFFLDPDGGGLLREFGDAGISGGLTATVAAGPIAGQLIATFDANDVRRRTLLQPHLVLANGEEHSLHVGNDVPIPVVSSDPGPALQTRLEIQRTDTGVTVTLRPVIGSEHDVQLDLDLLLSSLAPSLAGEVQRVGPTLTSEHVDARLSLTPGQTVIVAGSEQPVRRAMRSGTPFLRDLPLLGMLWRNDEHSVERQRLLVLLRVRALPGPDEIAALTARRALAFERARWQGSLGELPEGAPYALYIATRELPEAARELANRLDGEEYPARVVEWSADGKARYDVQLLGFRSLEEAADEATRLYREGYEADFAVVGDAERTLLEAAPRTPVAASGR